MQACSQEYKEAMKESGFRNRGYIKVYIGVINSEAQKRANVNDERNSFTYFSNLTKPFNGYEPETLYVTQEENFSHVDGSMYFLPKKGGEILFNNGLVTEELLGTIYVVFQFSGLDIKGLTIDFGECYPVDFAIENDTVSYEYKGNTQRYWSTEDTFDGTSFFKITPTKMVNGQGKLRIYKFNCGIANTFTNKEVKNYSFKDYVSPISETIPSQDMSLSVTNYDLYYSADNPESTIAYMEQGQEIEVSFGYDPIGNGEIEWLPPNTSYLKTWSANDREAKFTATDRFDLMTGIYYKGKFYSNGITLYDLAEDVILDAGVDEREYYIDPYLKKVIVYNPMPAVKHTEALQIIANAGRCVLIQNRKKQIQLKSLFLPDMTVESSDQTDFSNVSNILSEETKYAYAMQSNDFSVVDGSVYFLPNNTDYLDVGYVSDSVCGDERVTWATLENTYTWESLKLSGETWGSLIDKSIDIDYGYFDVNPQITITLEAGYSVFGLTFIFRNVAPKEFLIRTFYVNEPVQEFTVTDPSLRYAFTEELQLFDKIEFEFTKGYPNSRITLDRVIFGEATDYRISYHEITGNTPSSTRQDKIKSISVKKTTYSNSTEEIDELQSEDIVISEEGMEYTVYLSEASYGFKAVLGEPDGTALLADTITTTIIDSSAYFVTVRFTNVTEPGVNKKLSIRGYEYVKYESNYTKQYNTSGLEKTWSNPLVSTETHAKDLEEWLASYFLGDVDYSFNWRGDPRVDAYDLFFLERKNMEDAEIRSYENSLSFNGGWSGSMKARKVR